MNIYVGNLPYRTRNDELEALFAQYGEVLSVNIIYDRRTRRSKGYGFVEMADDAAGRKAIEALNGSDFGGRTLKVDEARRREEGAPQTRTPSPERQAPSGGLLGFLKRIFG
ncbi:MAG: RNA-binding protein [Gammaproteobacteria bacterium]|nr:MAG: RNA-binding protein [Gammaproteobacteria bacterium]